MGWGQIAAVAAPMVLDYIGGKKQREFGEDMANQQIAFQREMANTAHQRQVDDLRKAGLNPILSANSGASAPSGAMATSENVLGGAVNSAMEGRRLKKELDATQSQINLNNLQAASAASQAELNATSAKNVQAQTKLINLKLPTEVKRQEFEQQQLDWDKDAINFDNILKRATGVAEGVTTAVGSGINGILRGRRPDWVGSGPGGTKYHKTTGEILNKRNLNPHKSRRR